MTVDVLVANDFVEFGGVEGEGLRLVGSVVFRQVSGGNIRPFVHGALARGLPGYKKREKSERSTT